MWNEHDEMALMFFMFSVIMSLETKRRGSPPRRATRWQCSAGNIQDDAAGDSVFEMFLCRHSCLEGANGARPFSRPRFLGSLQWLPDHGKGNPVTENFSRHGSFVVVGYRFMIFAEC